MSCQRNTKQKIDMEEQTSNWYEGKTITLINGPWSGQTIEDLGTVKIRMAIAAEYEEDRTPKMNTKVGSAVYEPSEDRKVAFWLENEWDGRFAGRVGQ